MTEAQKEIDVKPKVKEGQTQKRVLEEPRRAYTRASARIKEIIKDITEQLKEDSNNNPNNNQALVKLDKLIFTMQQQIIHTTTDQCVESATETTEASHTESVGLKSSREAELEVQCRNQNEQIEVLQKQLLACQNQLQEQAVKHSQDQETLKMEIRHLKSQLCSNNAILQEPLEEKETGEQEREDKEDSLPQTSMSAGENDTISILT